MIKLRVLIIIVTQLIGIIMLNIQHPFATNESSFMFIGTACTLLAQSTLWLVPQVANSSIGAVALQAINLTGTALWGIGAIRRYNPFSNY